MLYEHQGLGCRRSCRPTATGGSRLRSEVARRPESQRRCDGRNLVAGIRPEVLEDATSAESSSSAGRRLTAPVTLFEPKAADRFNPQSRVRKGEVVEIGVASEDLHFFDPQTRPALTEVS